MATMRLGLPALLATIALAACASAGGGGLPEGADGARLVRWETGKCVRVFEVDCYPGSPCPAPPEPERVDCPSDPRQLDDDWYRPPSL